MSDFVAQLSNEKALFFQKNYVEVLESFTCPICFGNFAPKTHQNVEIWRHDTQHYAIQHKDIQHKHIQHKAFIIKTFSIKTLSITMLCNSARCHYGECRVLFSDMLKAV